MLRTLQVYVLYIYLYIHIVLGYTQGSWILPISLCSWICHCIEVDMCKYVYIYKCIYLVSLFIMILDYPIIIINCTSSLSDLLLQIDIYDYCGCQHLCIVSHVSSKFLLTQMFVPADWQTAKNHITRSYLFMYVNIYKCGNMVVSKKHLNGSWRFQPTNSAYFLLLDVCITGAIFIVFVTKETWWMGVGIGEHYASWLGRLGMVTVPVSTPKVKGNISNIRWLGGYLSPWLFSLWGMNVECRIVQRDTRPWYHTIISIIHDVSWNLIFFHKEPATVLESFCTSMTRSIWVTGAETVECKKPSQLKWL